MSLLWKNNLMTSNEIRQSFLEFFGNHGHQVVRSSSLVPVDDPTLLFTNAGMNQFKDLFLGHEQRPYKRATTAQKCMRVSGKHNDLNNVGPSHRHHTFFEMLGNFSFGDYFKPDAIPFAWRLLTEVWELPPDRLYPTIFKGDSSIPRDEEAYSIWRNFVPAHRIVELGLEENFWSMGDTGPCGRCSEVHFHRGNEIPCNESVCRGIDCSCERYVEIWNNVFMEFDRDTNGNMRSLPAVSIDTGMGLERIVAVLQGKVSNYDTDLFGPILLALEAATGRTYGQHTSKSEPGPYDTSMRVVADHLRAMTFLIADGVMPSNEWRGYVLRKIMRRAMRHGKKLGMSAPFLYQLIDILITEMRVAYPELAANHGMVTKVVQAEEERFDTVLTDGLPKLESVLENSAGALAGEDIFRLYDTYGLPLDFIEDIAEERKIEFDREGFDRAMESQRTQSRAKARFDDHDTISFSYGSDQDREALQAVPDRFQGYSTTKIEATSVVGLFDESRTSVPKLQKSESGYVLLTETPFYLEAGGQVSDTGFISTTESSLLHAQVDRIERLNPGGPRVHHIKIKTGQLELGATVSAEVDRTRRDAIRRNHTATHLLHAALRDHLGTHVKQAGSLVAPDRLRFDFTYGGPVSQETLDAIELKVNLQVSSNKPVVTEIRSTQEAINSGAMALFGEKYGESVRVVSVAGISMELCGGTHCLATGDIGLICITQESGVAAGIRRLEALTGQEAVSHLQTQRVSTNAILSTLAVPSSRAIQTIERLQNDVKRMNREVEALKMKLALNTREPEDRDDFVELGDARFIARKVSNLEKGSLRGLADSLRNQLGKGVVVLASENQGKVALIVSVSKDLVDRVHAGQVVKTIAPIIGGGGGGRPEFAEAGGRSSDRIDALLAESLVVVRAMLAPSSPQPQR